MNILFWIVGLIVIVGTGVLFGIRTWQNEDYERSDERYKNRKPLLLLAALGLVICIFGSSFVIIPTGSTGVKTTFGQVDSHTLSAGFSWKLPFIQSVEKVNNKQQDVNFESQIAAETKNRTTIYYNNIKGSIFERLVASSSDKVLLVDLIADETRLLVIRFL